MHDVNISPDAEAALDEVFQKWQRKWTDATTEAANNQAVGAINALSDAYAILGLETP